MRLPVDLRVPALAASNAMSGMLCGLLVMGATVVMPPAVEAKTDGAAIGKCLFKSCQLPLARCVTDPTCAANLLCIQTCNDRDDEGDCQIRCGDAFTNDVVADFTKCAVSDKSCVPQRQDDGSWPVPQSSALVKEFSTDFFEGNWYITAGLNKAFDTFDCQLHKFEIPAEGKLVGNLQWRIKDPVAGTNFVTRYAVQDFVQDKEQPGILYNGVPPYTPANEFLHYQDTWYILAAKSESYAVVYYRGSNDAWDGYGGAVIYSRDEKFPKKYAREIDESLNTVGLKLKDFDFTDNSCRVAETRLEEVKADLVFVQSKVSGGFGDTTTGVLDEVTKDLRLLESEVEMIAGAVGREIVKDVVTIEKEIVKDILKIEDELVKDEQAVEGFVKGLLRR